MSSLIHQMNPMLPIGEKQKVLNQFIAGAKEHDMIKILKDCEGLPSTLYNWLKLSLADKFRRFDLMMELLYDGDTAIISRVVSKRWLYEGEENSLTDCEFLLNKLFPNVSYNCRLKVLNKIGRYVLYEAKVDLIWNAVEQRYGFDVAFPLLQACSKAKISSVIHNRRVVLSGYQVVQILQKYPDIGLDYIKNNKMKASKMNPYCSPLHYLYKNRLDDFTDLCIDHFDKVKQFVFGRNRSTKMIRAHRAKLLKHPSETISLLKLDRIQREFSNEEFQTLFESTLPKGSENIESLWEWVKTVPLYKRIGMVNQAFTKIYQINLDEHPEFMNADYMLLLPEERRISAVESKMVNNTSYAGLRSVKGLQERSSRYDPESRKRSWLQLKPISHSVPELQKLLLIEQDINKRAVLSKYLIQTCYFNEDSAQLLNVLKLLSKRSRNDRCEVRGIIFKTLAAVMNKMEFSKEHWDIIIEMIQVSLVFKDQEDAEKEKMIGKALAFYLESNLPSDNLVTMHIKLKIQSGECTWSNYYRNKPAIRRMQLELYVKEMQNLQLTNDLCDYNGNALSEKLLTDLITNLIKEILEFNQDVKGKNLKPFLVSSHPWLTSNIERIAKEEETRFNSYMADGPHPKEPKFVLRYIPPFMRMSSRRGSRRRVSRRGNAGWKLRNATIPMKVFNKFFNMIQRLKQEQHLMLDVFNGPDYFFSKLLLFSPTHTVILHFLRTNPSHLIENWSVILPKMLKTRACVSLMRKLKFWNYSTLVGQTINKCSEILRETLETNPEVNVNQKCNAVLVLSALKEPSDFLALVTEFYPEKRAVVVADRFGDDYKIRKKFAKSLKNITVPHLTFGAIKKFCFGDYLKVTIGSLYSQLSRAPSVKSLDFLREQLVNVPVSLQKHIIRLYFAISSVEDKCLALQEIESTNISVRYELFLQAGKLFRSSPSQDRWTILKNIIKSTSAADKSILVFMHSTPKLLTCPSEYISEYIDACLGVLLKIQPSTVAGFTERIGNLMNKISQETLDNIVMNDYENQFKNQEKFNFILCLKYLQCSSTESILEHRLTNVWRILYNVIDLKESSWDLKESNYNSPRNRAFLEIMNEPLRNTNDNYPTRSLVLQFISSLCLNVSDPKKAWSQYLIFQTLLEKFKALSAIIFFREILYLELASLLVAEADFSGTERLRRFGCSLAKYVDSLVETYGGEIIFIVQDTFKYFVNSLFSNEFRQNVDMAVELVDGILETSKTRQNQIISLAFLSLANPTKANLTLKKIKKFLNESNDVIVQSYCAFKTH